MNQILDPLARLPGVRTAALITEDGVPITVQGQAAQEDPLTGNSTEQDALAALAASWVSEINRAVGTMSWDTPRHLVLRAVRGTLVAMQAPGALLVVVLESGASVEQLRLPMEGAVNRMERQMRPSGSRTQGAHMESPTAPLPSGSGWQADERVPSGGADQGVATNGTEVPEPAGE
jgi:predicted regulator of Ras-like GTPase activity (Roadblock/LC7/MglB family)